MRVAGAADFHRTDKGLPGARLRGAFGLRISRCKGSETGNCMEGEPCERWRTAWRGHPEFTPRGGERGNGGVWGEANEDQVEAPVGVKTK